MSKWTDYWAKRRCGISSTRCAQLRSVVLGSEIETTSVATWDSIDVTRRTVRRHLTGECPCDHDVPPLTRGSDGVWYSQNAGGVERPDAASDR